MHTDPIREQPDSALWEQALAHASLVVAHASVLTPGLREHATVVFPAESYAEKEGTVVHPDGRLQRLRTAIKRPGEVRAGWSVLTEIARRIGDDERVLTAPIAFRQLVSRVPFYAGLDARGDRRTRRALARSRAGRRRCRAGEVATDSAARPTSVTDAPAVQGPAPTSTTPQAATGALRIGTYRSIWAAPEVEISPALQFAIARQQVELSPADAQRLGITPGDAVVVAQNGTRLHAQAHIRAGIQEGTAFLADCLASDSANSLTEPMVEVRKA